MELIEETCRFRLGNTQYCLLPHPKARLALQAITQLDRLHQELVPLTVIRWAKSSFDDDNLETICKRFSIKDDVWCTEFLSVVVLLKPQHVTCKVKTNATVLVLNPSELKLAHGPYALCKATGQIYSVCRLYPDSYHAFVNGILPRARRKDDFRLLTSSDDAVPARSNHHLSSTSELAQIPVPSRLHSRPSQRRPLAGIRIAIKDVIRLQGVKTGFGNNAWRDQYPRAKTTAPAIELLLAAGAVVVGTVKTSEFGEGVDPHQWIGSTCPVNPRGDGEQKPSSSSTGSAVAAAAYPWLDCTIGTDTGGSIRHPAGVNGLFGNRPTQSAVDLLGVYSATDLLNTVGIFARDATMFSRIGTQLLPRTFQPLVPQSARKYKLLYPVRSFGQEATNPTRWFPSPLEDPSRLSEAEKQLEMFVKELEDSLACSRIPFNLDELWRAMKPRGQPSSLDEATGHIYSALVSYSAIHTGGINDFVKDFAASHAGAEPKISSIVKQRHEYGRSLKPSEIAKHLDSMRVFATWVEDVLFGPTDEEAITLLIFPQSFGMPNYRDEWSKDLVAYEKFSIYSFGYLVGCPDYTIPVGEVPFVSKFTGETAYLPVSLSMVARRGKDVPLFEVLTMLEGNGVLKGVKTGRKMY